MNLEVAQMLVCTTGHISEDTAQLLNNHAKIGTAYYDKANWGWFFPVHQEEGFYDGREETIPPELLNVLLFGTWLSVGDVRLWR